MGDVVKKWGPEYENPNNGSCDSGHQHSSSRDILCAPDQWMMVWMNGVSQPFQGRIHGFCHKNKPHSQYQHNPFASWNFEPEPCSGHNNSSGKMNPGIGLKTEKIPHTTHRIAKASGESSQPW